MTSATPKSLLKRWEQAFRASYEVDKGAQLQTLIARFELSISSKEMLEGTIDVVSSSCAFLTLDGRDIQPFLADQCYDARPPVATYCLTFDLFGRGAARLLLRPDLEFLDLADLYECPWNRLEVVGYEQFWVSRLDGQALSAAEIDELDRVVSRDLRFDFGEAEVLFYLDPDSFEKAVSVVVYDAPSEEMRLAAG